MNIILSIHDPAGHFCDFLNYSLSYPVLHSIWLKRKLRILGEICGLAGICSYRAALNCQPDPSFKLLLANPGEIFLVGINYGL